MNASRTMPRALGVAFLLQFVTSLASGSVLRQAWDVPGNISETMGNIANSPGLLTVNILLDMTTALGIIFLGAMLFVTLKKQNEEVALVALGFYVLEAALLAASRAGAFSLLGLSREYATADNPAFLETLGSLALESMDFVGTTLHILVFSIGAILFYYLFYRSRAIPRALSLWGLITVIPILIGVVAAMFGLGVPFAVYAPYIPFEFVVGVWILAKGITI